MRTSSQTAEIAAAMRAAELAYPEERRMLTDRIAVRLLRDRRFKLLTLNGPLARAALKVCDRKYTGIVAEVLLRCRYADEVLRDAYDVGIRQLVVLGAGYDSTAHRHRLDDGFRIYEVDHPVTQSEKRNRIAAEHLSPLTPVAYVQCDFSKDRIPDALANHPGFDPRKPTLYSWLAVTMYLDGGDVARTMRDIRHIAAPGSLLLMDYMYREVIDGTSQHKGALATARNVARRGEPYVFGWQPIEIDSALCEFGFKAREHLSVSDLANRLPDRTRFAHPVRNFMGVVLAEVDVM
ncbi:SAM-dependent methyltransferase [Streptomyces sp. NBC_01481]|uniref:class I SAM-dependent methyltransferase n=1 Tax=Streptomyces sp. NBC_01481 TaxID=2975869 RepID=UPI002253AD16|nr:SAM-dependent methyltransferase [Streptomyces sp. NBC_01481]MCX4588131.1 SAM-dependent methyltransferase [Streptomyces sp. NBC_01481]